MALDATASLYDSAWRRCVTCAVSSKPRSQLASNIHLDLLGPATWITFIFFFKNLPTLVLWQTQGFALMQSNQIVPHDVMQGDKPLCKTEVFLGWTDRGRGRLDWLRLPRRRTFLAPSKLVGARRFDRIGLISAPHFPRTLDGARAGCDGSCVV